MKISFIHTGDLHLGRQFDFKNDSYTFGKSRRMELWQTFDKIISTAEKNKIHFLIISGDLFDSENVALSEVKAVSERFSRLSHTKVIICPGNHDFYDAGHLYGLVDWPENVTIFNTGDMQSVYFPETETRIFGIGWTKDTYRKLPWDGSPLELREEDNNILVLHGDAYHSQSDYMPIDLDAFAGFDYIALGHVHKAAFLSKRAAYCGCPEPLSFNDDGDQSIVVGQIDRHRLNTQVILTRKRRFITVTLDIKADMTIEDIRRKCLMIDSEKERMRNFYRIRFKGYRDTLIAMDLLYEELSQLFYYVEIDDSELLPDLDVDRMLAENQHNVIGRFIQEMRRYAGDPIAKSALYYGLEGFLQAETMHHDH